MECHEVQQLLAFALRQNELDAPERDALREHIEKCPDCSAMLQAERRSDEVLGAVLRDVAVPADLKGKVLTRLAAERGRARRISWKRGALAAAAAVLIVSAAGVAWEFWPSPVVNRDTLRAEVALANWDENRVEQYFKEQGLVVRAPREFNYQLLQHVDIVEFNGRRVAKLTFARADERPAFVNVLILSSKQFRMDDLATDQEINATTSIRVRHDADYPEFTFVIFYRGAIEGVLRPPPI